MAGEGWGKHEPYRQKPHPNKQQVHLPEGTTGSEPSGSSWKLLLHSLRIFPGFLLSPYLSLQQGALERQQGLQSGPPNDPSVKWDYNLLCLPPIRC